MSANSKIEWTDATWNPVRGCTKVSPGCKHCYAETFAERFRGVKGHPFEFGFDLRLVPEKLGDPIRWGTPRKVFVNSMSDLFHPEVSDSFIEDTCRVMLAANWHTYQVLTKRADRMCDLLKTKLRTASLASHIWWGVSVENKVHGLPRIDLLRKAAPSVAFLSIEPLLEDLGQFSLSGIHSAMVRGQLKLAGFVRSALNAGCKASHSFSSSGEESVNPTLAANSTGELTTSFLMHQPIQSRRRLIVHNSSLPLPSLEPWPPATTESTSVGNSPRSNTLSWKNIWSDSP
jgi:protein gp37